MSGPVAKAAAAASGDASPERGEGWEDRLHDHAAAYVDEQDCLVRNEEGDFDGYTGHQMVHAFLAGARLSRTAPEEEVAAVTRAIADPGQFCGFRADEGMVAWQARAAIMALTTLRPPVPAEPVAHAARELLDALAPLRESNCLKGRTGAAIAALDHALAGSRPASSPAGANEVAAPDTFRAGSPAGPAFLPDQSSTLG